MSTQWPRTLIFQCARPQVVRKWSVRVESNDSIVQSVLHCHACWYRLESSEVVQPLHFRSRSTVNLSLVLMWGVSVSMEEPWRLHPPMSSYARYDMDRGTRLRRGRHDSVASSVRNSRMGLTGCTDMCRSGVTLRRPRDAVDKPRSLLLKLEIERCPRSRPEVLDSYTPRP